MYYPQENFMLTSPLISVTTLHTKSMKHSRSLFLSLVSLCVCVCVCVCVCFIFQGCAVVHTDGKIVEEELNSIFHEAWSEGGHGLHA